MDNSFAVIFDMDGVIVDSLQALYDIYLKALSKQSIQGTRAEFNEMNGPHMDDVVSILSERHQINKQQLKSDFSQLQTELYDRVKLINGSKFLIKKLHSRGIQLAIASSASHKNILKVLNKFGLTHYFIAIISGEDVVEAKPSPEIYLKAKSHLDSPLIFGIDDSPSGITSMKSAGVCSIQFLNHEITMFPPASYHVDTMEQLPLIFDQTCVLLYKGSDFYFTKVSALGEIDTKSVDKTWQAYQSKGLYNGNALLCHGFRNKELLITQSDYKTVLHLLSQPIVSQCLPLGISGIVLDDQGSVITAQRASDTTQYPLYWEFPPSGSAEFSCENGVINHIYQELEEELNLLKKQVEFIKVLGVTYDYMAKNYDILILIKLNCSVKNCKINSEYKDIKVVNKEQLEQALVNHDFTPESLLKLQLTRELLNENC